MEMSKREVVQLLRIARSPEPTLAANNTLSSLSTRFNMTKRIGNWIHVTDEDRKKAKDLLAQQKIDADKVKPEDWIGLTRVQAMALGANEKLATGPVKRRRVSVTALAGCYLKRTTDANTHFKVPPKGCLSIDWEELIECQHNCMLVVENFEVFENIHLVDIDPGRWDPMVVYRGDPHESGAGVVNAFLEAVNKPVFYFGDMDPAGLQIGLSLPGFFGLVLPSTADLQHAMKVRSQTMLFDKQIAGARRRIEASKTPSVMRAWAAIQEAKAGFSQEFWVGKGYRHYLG